jgi:hypothetical protein
MMKNLVLTIMLAYVLFAALGCANTGKKDNLKSSPSLLEPSSSLKFNDVPVPTGFKFIPEDSFSFESYGVRVGTLRYQGKADADLVVNFYKEQMPMYNWNLLNVVEYGERLLNFDRDDETCIISLKPKRNHITLSISLGPKSQVSKKSLKPIK